MRPPSSLRRYARCRPAPHPSNDFPDAAEVYARRILWISARTGSARQEQGFFAQALKPTYVGCSLQQAIRRLVHELPRCGNDFRYLRHHFLVLSAKVVRRQFPTAPRSIAHGARVPAPPCAGGAAATDSGSAPGPGERPYTHTGFQTIQNSVQCVVSSGSIWGMGLLYPMTRFLPRLYDWVKRSRILRMYGELRLLEDEMANARDTREMVARLDSLERQANHLRVPSPMRTCCTVCEIILTSCARA